MRDIQILSQTEIVLNFKRFLERIGIKSARSKRKINVVTGSRVKFMLNGKEIAFAPNTKFSGVSADPISITFDDGDDS